MQLQNLACSGETTDGMINGGACQEYAKSTLGITQLSLAVQFITTHNIAFITIDVGANDVLQCLNTIDFATCIQPTFSNLSTILAQLRAAAGPTVPIVGMNYYSPFLAFWVSGDHADATNLTNGIVLPFNNALDATFATSGMPVADVQTAFSTTDFTTIVNLDGVGPVPLNVARICEWTWMCQVGNIHANSAGYGVIANAFDVVLGF